ncbi:unnamed protein product [Rhizophagus irregularis]|nr:unnamed protein product [Rhizophagus irregularis]
MYSEYQQFQQQFQQLQQFQQQLQQLQQFQQQFQLSTLSTMSTISTISISTFDIINNVNNINNLSNLICYGQPFLRLGRTKSINEIILKKMQRKRISRSNINSKVLPRSQHQLEGQLALKRDELKDEQLSNKAAVQEIFF